MDIQKILKELEKIEVSRSTLQNVILALLAIDNKPIHGKIKIQKMIFLLSHIIPELKEEVSYEAYDYGMYDSAVDDALDLLESENLIVISDNNEIRLVDKNSGEEALKSLEKYKDKIKEIKDTYNDLTEDELLAIIYTLFPEYTKYSEKREEIERKRKSIAVRLYQKGKVSLGLASKIAGMNLHDFIDILKRKGIKIELEDDSGL